MTKTNTTKAAELLLEYQKHLDEQVLKLRAEACDLAAKSREITKLIPEEQKQDVAEQAEADESWSLKNVIGLMNGAK